MNEVFLIAGKNDHDLSCLQTSISQQGYSSTICKSPEELVDQLELYPICSINISLVIIEKEMLLNLTDDLLTKINEHAAYTRFILLDDNQRFVVADWILGNLNDRTITGSNLSEYIKTKVANMVS